VQRASTADANHLRAAVLTLSRFTGNMSEVSRFLRIGHVDDRRAVLFVLAGDRVPLCSTVMADVSDPAIALMVNRGLVGASRLQIIVTDERHLALVCSVLCRDRRAQSHAERCDKCEEAAHSARIILPLVCG
jgi:hypothetical protein